LLNPIKCCALFLFREALLCQSHHEARRSVPLTPRLEWQDERRSFCFPPPVGAGIHSRERQGRAASASQRTFSLSTRRTFSLSSDILAKRNYFQSRRGIASSHTFNAGPNTVGVHEHTELTRLFIANRVSD